MPTECLMCKKGFKMNKEKHCGGDPIEVTTDGGDEDGTDGGDGNGTDGNASMSIFTNLFIVLFVILLK